MKKKRIDDIDRYITDALIVSDEWDNFDYNLQSEIKELAQIDYDGTPLDWKKNTLAFGYLSHVEKLLLEKYRCGDHEIENIRELQGLIEKYNHLKTFLLTLRIATIAYRAGMIPKLVQSEIDKQERRNETVGVRQKIIHMAIECVFVMFPDKITLGALWKNFNPVNKNRVFVSKKTGREFRIEKVKDKIIILDSNNEPWGSGYKKRSLGKFVTEYQKFIKEHKKLPPKLHYNAIV